jgi:D-alanyl-D-alanine carboxypeptidase
VVVALLMLATGVSVTGCTAEHPSRQTTTPTITAPASAKAAPVFDKAAASTSDPASLWVVVNKKHPLKPIDYAPRDLVYPNVPNANHQPLRRAAADALVKMVAAAHSEARLTLALESGYRGYRTQLQVYNESVERNGKAVADELTARPGTSEHQTGLAADISSVPPQCSLQECFGTTAPGKWLGANAWRFGFVLRYPADKVAVTGYAYEPWHFRYVGVPLATELHRSHTATLEEFFHVSGGRSY